MGAVFISILNMSFTASYIILFVMLIRLPLKKAPKAISYTLWGVAGFRLIVPFSFESIFSLMPRNMNTAPIPRDIIYQQSPQINSGIVGVDSFINQSLPAPAMGASANPLQMYVEIGAYVWVLGIIALLAYSVISMLLLKRQLKDARFIEKNIFETANLKTPFVFGLIQPRIYLPLGLDVEERSYILFHEQIHIQRKDHLIKIGAFLMASLHWFNPLVWVAFVLMSTDMELSCDERVLKEMNEDIKKPYATSLLSLAMGRRILNGSPLAFGEGNVKGRIKNVMQYKKPGFWVVLVSVIVVIGVGIALLSNPTSPQGMRGENEFRGRIAIITEAAELENPYAITVDTDNKIVYQELDNIKVSLNKNDMIIVIEEEDERCRVVLIAGDIPAPRGTIEKNKLSYDTSLFKNNANQAIVKDAMSYDGINGNEKGLESGIGMVIERKDDWARVALPMLESDLWFKSDSLSYAFDTSIMDYTKAEVDLFVGYMVIKDNTLHVDEVEIVEWEDQERVKELDLDLQNDMLSGYAIINENQEEITYELADKVEYIFTDLNLNFIEEPEGDRIYRTTKKDEFLKHLGEYNLNDIPLFEQRIPYFIEVQDGKVIRITEKLKYTI